MGTLTACNRMGVVAAHLTVFNENSIGQDPAEPLQTVMAGAPRFGVVGAALAPRGTTGAFLVQTGYGERPGQAPRALDVDAPLGTQVTRGGKHAVCAAWMVQHNGGEISQGADRPVSTLTTAGTQQQVGAAFLAKLRGTSTAPSGTPLGVPAPSGTDRSAMADEPAPTITAGGNHIAAIAAFLTTYDGRGVGQGPCEPLRTATTEDRHGVVVVHLDGEPYAVVDIGMRMLEPREAAAAHELRLPDLVEVRGVRRPLTKKEAMRLVGNSVPKRMARLIARANRVDALRAPAGDKLAADRDATSRWRRLPALPSPRLASSAAPWASRTAGAPPARGTALTHPTHGGDGMPDENQTLEFAGQRVASPDLLAHIARALADPRLRDAPPAERCGVAAATREELLIIARDHAGDVDLVFRLGEAAMRIAVDALRMPGTLPFGR